MEFRIAKDELTRALARVQGIVEKRSTNPIIANVLLEVGDDLLRVTATDTEISFVGSYAVQHSSPGSITLAARQLYDIARNAPDDTIAFQLPAGSDQVEIRSGRSFFKVLGLPAEQFPRIASPGGGDGVRIEAVALKQLIDKVSFSISTDDTRAGLAGASLEVLEDGASLRLASTDGHRLSVCGRPFEGTLQTGRTSRPLLPRKGLTELRKLLDGTDGAWLLSFTDNQAWFRFGGMAFSMRLLEGEFPDYKAVIPASWQRRVFVPRAELEGTLRRVSILATEKTHPVRFSVGDNTLTVKAQHPEAGEAVETLEAQVDGGPLDIGFNARYFRDALSALSSDTVAIEIGDSLSPCLVKPGEGGSDEVYVIMPMRLE